MHGQGFTEWKNKGYADLRSNEGVHGAFTHGNFCGHGGDMGLDPVDDIDAACLGHDLCYGTAQSIGQNPFNEYNYCDYSFGNDLDAILVGPLNPFQKSARAGAKTWLYNKQMRQKRQSNVNWRNLENTFTAEKDAKMAWRGTKRRREGGYAKLAKRPKYVRPRSFYKVYGAHKRRMPYKRYSKRKRFVGKRKRFNKRRTYRSRKSTKSRVFTKSRQFNGRRRGRGSARKTALRYALALAPPRIGRREFNYSLSGTQQLVNWYALDAFLTFTQLWNELTETGFNGEAINDITQAGGVDPTYLEKMMYFKFGMQRWEIRNVSDQPVWLTVYKMGAKNGLPDAGTDFFPTNAEPEVSVLVDFLRGLNEKDGVGFTTPSITAIANSPHGAYLTPVTSSGPPVQYNLALQDTPEKSFWIKKNWKIMSKKRFFLASGATTVVYVKRKKPFGFTNKWVSQVKAGNKTDCIPFKTMLLLLRVQGALGYDSATGYAGSVAPRLAIQCTEQYSFKWLNLSIPLLGISDLRKYTGTLKGPSVMAEKITDA